MALAKISTTLGLVRAIYKLTAIKQSYIYRVPVYRFGLVAVLDWTSLRLHLPDVMQTDIVLIYIILYVTDEAVRV